MITAAQLDVLFEYPRPITEAEAAAFNAIALTSETVDDGLADVEAIRPWLAALGITRPEPRIGVLARRLAGAARRMAARG